MARRASPPRATAKRAAVQLTASLVDVDRVVDGCCYLYDGTFCYFVEVDGIGFDLLRPEEQDTILLQYQSAIHTLTAPVVVVQLTEPLDLGPEIERYARPDPRLDPAWQDVSQAFAEMLVAESPFVERVVYLYVVGGPSVGEAFDRAQSLARALQPVHPDLHPRVVRDTDRVVALLHQAYAGERLPAPAHQYFPLIDRIWTDAPRSAEEVSS
jgi:hypothetical protein